MPRRGERKYTTMMLYPAMNTLTKNILNSCLDVIHKWFSFSYIYKAS